MNLPRYQSSIVRAGASPEIVTTRNFDDLESTLSDAFGILEKQMGDINASFSKVNAKILALSLTGIAGTGAAGRVAIWTGTSALGTDNFYWDTTNDRLGVGSGASSPSYDIQLSKSVSGSNVEIVIQNSNTAANSNTALRLQASGGTTAGDTFVIFDHGGGSTYRSITVDASDSYAMKFINGQTMAGTVVQKIDFAQQYVAIGPNYTGGGSGEYLAVGHGASGVNSRVAISVRNTASGSANATAEFYASCITYAGIQLDVATAGGYWRMAVNGNVTRQLVIAQDSTSLLNNPVLRFTPSSFLAEFPSGVVKAKAGASSSQVAFGGALDINVTTVGNIGAGEDDLMTYSVPASTLGTNKDSLKIVCAGQFAASAANKRLRGYFGSDLIFDTGVLAITSATDWVVEITIIRTGAATQRCIALFASSSATLSSFAQYSIPARTLSSANTFKLTGEATNDSDVIQTLMKTEWCSAP